MTESGESVELEPVAYLIDVETFNKLRRMEQELHAGTGRERDYGHKLWLALNDAIPMTELDIDQTKLPSGGIYR